MHLTFARYIALPALSLLLMLPQSGLASQSIGGDYCGKVMSGGEWVDVVTTLTTRPDGLLSGKYEFNDKGKLAPGTLRENNKASEDARVFTWVDKYGTGTLMASFSENRASFEGLWGDGDEMPGFGWTGQRCNMDSVRNST